MALEIEHDCPGCDEAKTFYRSASMTLHLGLKTKWACAECSYAFVQVNGIDTSTA